MITVSLSVDELEILLNGLFSRRSAASLACERAKHRPADKAKAEEAWKKFDDRYLELEAALLENVPDGASS